MSYSIEAREALIVGIEEWDDYRQHEPDIIDLTLVDLKGLDLRARNFIGCDLSGADLDNANLDGARFEGTIMKDASFTNASFVNVVMSGVNLAGAILRDAVLRGATLVDVAAERTIWNGAMIVDSSLEKCNLDNMRADGLRIHSSELRSCKLTDISAERVQIITSSLRDLTFARSTFTAADLSDCSFTDSIFETVRLFDARIMRSKFRESYIRGLEVCRGTVGDLDFSGSTLIAMDLAGLSLPTCVMLGASVIDCIWPEQGPTVGWLGRYRRSDMLLSQPVQDLAGLRPALRREIADAQYIDELFQSATRWPRKVGLRMWGAFTKFGQSILRLSAWSGTMIGLSMLLLALTNFRIWRLKDTAAVARSAVEEAISNFFGLPFVAQFRLTSFQNAVIIIDRVAGFIILGLWIAIAATKLGRLSAS